MKRAPPANYKSHPRARIFELVRQALSGKGLDILHVFQAKAAAAVVTKILLRVVPPAVLALAPGTFVASHSLRKTAASALAAAGADTVTSIMPWGDWNTHSALMAYIVRNFPITNYSRILWDWLNTVPPWGPPEHGGRLEIEGWTQPR